MRPASGTSVSGRQLESGRMDINDHCDPAIEPPVGGDVVVRDSTIDPQGVAAEMPHATASWVVSLCFWMTLVLAAVIYSGVALSPKLAEWISAREQFAGNAAQLVQLENDIEYLERVKDALESDPQFAFRLAEASMPEPNTQGEIVPVATELLYGGLTVTTPLSAEAADARRSGTARVVFHFASHQTHRQLLLVTSVLLTVLGFTFLNDSESGSLRTIGRTTRWLCTFPLRRYSKSATRTANTAEIETTGFLPTAAESPTPIDRN